MGTGERKVRSDKKIDLKPSIPIPLKEAVYRLSFITQTPVKNVAEYLIIEGLQNSEIIGDLSIYFKREIKINSTIYRGNITNPTIKKRDSTVQLDRISLRVKLSTYNLIAALSYALDCSKAKVCALLIEHSMNNLTIVNHYVENYLKSQLDRNRMSELKRLMQFINKNNKKEEHSWATLFSHIVSEVNAPIQSVKDVVDDFIIHHWKRD